MKKIIFATGNVAKLGQIKYIANHFKFSIEVINGRDKCGDKAKYEEKGGSVEEIAKNGAIAVAKAIGEPVITEDTDFCINALNDEPGVDAGAFLKEFGREKIIELMIREKDRRASISSAVAYAEPGGKTKVFINKIEGLVSRKERFKDFPTWISPQRHALGGGYNAIFIPDGYKKTLAEIGPDKALGWSYREKNFEAVLRYLVELK